ncbi:hypothetical protein [Acinetobacter sp. CFCC 10889]|uniref:hypothetical protein n=1 Tax=Acinetobacter sp. CFCC 10889 TaxID=1775557 RepID=UPI000DD0B9DE|nr:hypothetical protein [Acinetobacter sp. CFCC 10889]
MTNQKKECCECSKVLELLIKLTEQNNQLIQINNEQNAQINHLLEHLDEDQEVDSLGGRSLDGG